MVSAKISRHIMFSGPSPSNSMHNKYNYATINTENIILSKNVNSQNVTTENVNSQSVTINSSSIIFTILNGVLNISGIPNSSGGLNNGDIWRDVSGYLRIK